MEYTKDEYLKSDCNDHFLSTNRCMIRRHMNMLHTKFEFCQLTGVRGRCIIIYIIEKFSMIKNSQLLTSKIEMVFTANKTRIDQNKLHVMMCISWHPLIMCKKRFSLDVIMDLETIEATEANSLAKKTKFNASPGLHVCLSVVDTVPYNTTNNTKISLLYTKSEMKIS
jgi:hypothetical protein